MKANNLVVLSEYNTAMEAELAKTVLGSAGIYAEIENEIMSSLYPTGIIPSKLLVREEDTETAKRLLTQR
ncbi:MAG: DUF2007 domain-containing protein [Alistipes sp.]|nr:DUF2007 domain-containing protein [Alistipes sp.]